MQIQLFPDDVGPDDVGPTIQCGQAGPVRFAATATSYPHLSRLLANLVSERETLSPTGGDKA
ncbi:MAG: hypothetical protein PVF97_08250 [Desulfobacterales bacterium]|jgi:hypothetical protein